MNRRNARRLSLVFAAVLLVGLQAAFSWAAGLKPFDRGSYKEIVTARSGKPFILVFWSLTCPYCREDLSLLGNLRRKYPGLDLVVVSTDSPGEAPAIAEVLREHSLDGCETWVFADPFSERLRAEVDLTWYGELPRFHLSGGDGKTRVVIGRADPGDLEAWIRANTAPGKIPAAVGNSGRNG
ncbi:MAG: redoxin domain-containing protein [Nitrospirae bacterium]|nr:redoxin domain-containing protein [Nitrospirota bacterium]